ncbi:hypothetical protein F4779DRAFT_614821 [Xylariaceae sp. FL0662B]|nr:hypothetical protein F4779DRAFT_614821 [Xylariaceae sp. FL0662B]
MYAATFLSAIAAFSGFALGQNDLKDVNNVVLNVEAAKGGAKTPVNAQIGSPFTNPAFDNVSKIDVVATSQDINVDALICQAFLSHDGTGATIGEPFYKNTPLQLEASQTKVGSVLCKIP